MREPLQRGTKSCQQLLLSPMLLFMRLEARPPTHRLVRDVGWKKRDHVTMVLNMDINALTDSEEFWWLDA